MQQLNLKQNGHNPYLNKETLLLSLAEQCKKANTTNSKKLFPTISTFKYFVICAKKNYELLKILRFSVI